VTEEVKQRIERYLKRSGTGGEAEPGKVGGNLRKCFNVGEGVCVCFPIPKSGIT